MSKETFTSLLAPNLDAIRGFVRRRMRDRDLADDVLQQTLLLAFSRRAQLRVQSKFRSWLWSIAVNEIRLFLRSRRIGLSLDELPRLEFPDGGRSPLEEYEMREARRLLQSGMAGLPERDHAALRLELEELTVPEAAAQMKMSRSAAKSARFRARRRLAHVLSTRPQIGEPRCLPATPVRIR